MVIQRCIHCEVQNQQVVEKIEIDNNIKIKKIDFRFTEKCGEYSYDSCEIKEDFETVVS